MTVFVVTHGEQNNGGFIVSVHKKKKDAIKVALSTDRVFAGGWIPDEDNENYWENGCDFVAVLKYQVK